MPTLKARRLTMQRLYSSISSLFALLGYLLILPAVFAAPQRVPDAKQVVEAIGSPQGICIVLGDDALALDLARQSELRVYFQSDDERQVESLRKAAETG